MSGALAGARGGSLHFRHVASHTRARRSTAIRRPRAPPPMTAIREAIAHGDVEAFGDALAPDAVWVGTLPGQLCRNRVHCPDRRSAHAALERMREP